MLPALLRAATESALAEIEALREAAEAERQEDRFWGLRHSLHVIRTFPDVRQALRQLQGYSRFAAMPAKQAAYREAFEVLTRHTGESPSESKPKHDPELQPALF